MTKVILSNNPLVEAKLKAFIPVDFKHVSLLDLMKIARDAIHEGSVLLTHPLSGSIKPNQTPYKSLMLEEGKVGVTDFASVELIESAIQTTEKLMQGRPIDYIDTMPEPVKEDFQLIDLSLIASALPSAGIHVTLESLI